MQFLYYNDYNNNYIHNDNIFNIYVCVKGLECSVMLKSIRNPGAILM